MAPRRADAEPHLHSVSDGDMMIYRWPWNGVMSRASDTHFVQYLGEEVTVLHLVRFGWQARGPKNWGGGRRSNTPYLDCTNTVLDLGSFSRARGERANQRGNIRRRLGRCLFLFPQCVPYGHRGWFSQSIKEHSRQAGGHGRLCKVGEMSSGVLWPAPYTKA